MTVVSSALVRDWAQCALTHLGEARAEIDALNVFPVPDGDTGTNLYLTMESAAESVDRCWDAALEVEPSVDVVARAFSTGALLGARGNSGVILSQLLRGSGEVLAALSDGVMLDGEMVRDLLRRGADLSYQAVARPVEGTILTVARAAADAAAASVDAGTRDAATVLSAAAQGAQLALDRTPQMLETLRLAGVVDAGGRGLVVVLDALAEAVSGIRRVRPVARTHHPSPRTADDAATYAGPAYEVMFLFDGNDAAAASLREVLDSLGESLVFVGGDELWNVHVHVNDAGAAVEAAVQTGRPHRIRITHLVSDGRVLQVAQGRAIVAVTHGPGTAALLETLGATIVPAAANTRPSTAELLEAIRRSQATEVVVLPSDKDTRAVADAAAQQARVDGVRVLVIPTRSIVQTLAAAAVHDPLASTDDDVVAMTRAAGATRYAGVTIATRQALTTAGPCEVGDVLGLVDGDIVLVGAEVEKVCRELLTGMLAIGGELVTLVTGSDAGTKISADLPEWLELHYPLVEVVCYDGGQPLWPVIMGVE